MKIDGESLLPTPPPLLLFYILKVLKGSKLENRLFKVGVKISTLKKKEQKALCYNFIKVFKLLGFLKIWL